MNERKALKRNGLDSCKILYTRTHARFLQPGILRQFFSDSCECSALLHPFNSKILNFLYFFRSNFNSNDRTKKNERLLLLSASLAAWNVCIMKILVKHIRKAIAFFFSRRWELLLSFDYKCTLHIFSAIRPNEWNVVRVSLILWCYVPSLHCAHIFYAFFRKKFDSFSVTSTHLGQFPTLKWEKVKT